MTRLIRRPYTVDIPIDWTPAQADAVFEFLSLLATAIWDAYDEKLTEIAQAQLLASRIDEAEHNDDFLENDLPF